MIAELGGRGVLQSAARLLHQEVHRLTVHSLQQDKDQLINNTSQHVCGTVHRMDWDTFVAEVTINTIYTIYNQWKYS